MSTSRDELDRSLVHGIAWTSAVTWFSQLLSWGSTFFVAHHLATTDYGLVGSAGIYLGVVAMVSEFGLGAAVVRFRSLSRNEVGQFNMLSVMLGIGAMLLSWVMTIPVSRFLDEPRLPPVMGLMSLAFLISSFRVVPQAVLQRDKRFRRLALMEGTQSICMATASITMAALGFGYWTLAIAPIIGTTVYMVLAVSANPLPFRRPKLESIREPFAFSRQTIFTRFAWFGYSNADFFVISKMLGQAAMGTYFLGWTVAGMAVEKITALVGRVTPSFFSTLQNDLPALRRYLKFITEGLALLTFPVCVGLALVADDLVLMIGPQWESAGFAVMMLAIVATVRSIDPLVQQVLAAIGQTQINLENALVTVCVLPPTFIFAAGGWGVDGVAVAWLVAGPLLFSRLLFRALRRIEMPAAEYFSALWPAVSACLAMSAGVIAVKRAEIGGGSLYLSVIVQILTGVVCYVGTLLLLHRERVLKLAGVIRVLRSPNPKLVETASAVPPVTA
jgi:O-antigen/teichoic acid export membrane protein